MPRKWHRWPSSLRRWHLRIMLIRQVCTSRLLSEQDGSGRRQWISNKVVFPLPSNAWLATWIQASPSDCSLAPLTIPPLRMVTSTVRMHADEAAVISEIATSFALLKMEQWDKRSGIKSYRKWGTLVSGPSQMRFWGYLHESDTNLPTSRRIAASSRIKGTVRVMEKCSNSSVNLFRPNDEGGLFSCAASAIDRWNHPDGRRQLTG